MCTLNLITVEGKSARKLFVDLHHIADFKSVLRSVTSGRVLIVPTRFRTDLFYCSEKPKVRDIIKLWVLYSKTNLTEIDLNDFTMSNGDERALCKYFQSINKLSTNWHKYKVYRNAIQHSFRGDQWNPVATTVLKCDRHLTEHPNISRSPLLNKKANFSMELSKDTFSLAMRIINDESHFN